MKSISSIYAKKELVNAAVQEPDNENLKREEEGTKEDKVLDLLNEYKEIKDEKESNDSINDDDIDKLGKSDESKKALKEWLKIKKRISHFTIGYFVYIIGVLILLDISKSKHFLCFFITYSFFYLFSTLFYWFLFSHLYLKSFWRLSYSVLYPTILTISINLYFGLSAKNLCAEKLLIVEFVPIIIFALFFIVTAFFEIVSYKGGISKKTSTHGFVGTSVVLLSISIIVFFLSTGQTALCISTTSFSNQLFAIALALFLGIFEGWDALVQMNIDENSNLFAKHYRWWNFLQVCYPLAFFFLMAAVDSEIFTFGLMIMFTVVSVISTVFWKRGGEKEWYNKTNWGRLKLVFGIGTIISLFINKLCFMNNILGLKTPPIGLDTKNINVEIIVFFLGLVSSIFVFLGVDSNEQKQNVIMAIPFKNASRYEDFTKFCRYGYIYDFSNYIYLFYLLIVHVLLFSTNFISARSKQAESASTILIIFMIIIYMIFSARAKIMKVHSNLRNVQNRG